MKDLHDFAMKIDQPKRKVDITFLPYKFIFWVEFQKNKKKNLLRKLKIAVIVPSAHEFSRGLKKKAGTWNTQWIFGEEKHKCNNC